MSTPHQQRGEHDLRRNDAESAPVRSEERFQLSRRRQRSVWLELGFVALLFLVALFLRTWQLDHFPPGLYNDEAAYGMDGRALLAGDLRIFYERNNGREPLFIYLLALAFQALGATPYAIRLTAAVVGALTVITTYWMVRSLFCFAPETNDQSARWYAGWTALFLTFSYWHLSLSRLGLRAITLPLALTIAFALFWMVWRRLQTPGGAPWALASLTGLALSLPLYTYTAGRMTPLLFVVTVAATWLLAPGFAIDRTRLLKTAAAMVLAALLGALPLLLYFVQHPTAFGAHAFEVSVLNTRYAGDNPLLALLQSATRTFLLFGLLPDENLRHNPAQIPVFDPLLAMWLLLGVGLAVYGWRRLKTLFVLAWLLLLATPAILSSEGVPHSLRMIGTLPAVYVLPVLALAWAAARARRRQMWWRWLPLPFLLIAAFVGVTGYFGAWTPIERFRSAFRTDYADFARTLAAGDTSTTLWVLPLLDAQALTDGKFNTIDFFQRDPGAFATLPADETTAAAALTRLTQGRRFVAVLRPTDAPHLQATSWLFADVKGLFALLLRRNSVGTATTGEMAGIPYTVYALDEIRSFALPSTERRITDAVFGDTFQLTGVNLGGGSQWLWQDDALAMPADRPLWVVLRWSALANAPTTQHKTSLVLRDSAGNIVGQSDALLVSDRQPGVLDSTYQVIDLPPGAPPGRYRLELRVYEDATGRTYPVTQAGRRAAFLSLAEVTAQPPLQPGAALAPQIPIDVASMPQDFQLIGYDLPRTEIAPGEALPLALYLHAPITPTNDYALQVTLTDENGAVVAQQTSPAGGAAFPTLAWRAGETLRSPAPLRVDPMLHNGLYGLHVAVLASADEAAAVDLGEITVSGRPHVFTAPPISQPLDASFGESVRLVGINAAPEITVAPGAALDLALIWQPAGASAQPLVRFVQVLDANGALVAQQDTIPCDGACAASSWLEGEYLLDPVTITLPPEMSGGAHQLIVGWYDADSQQRLPAFDAANQRLAGDVLTLPTVLTVSR